MRKQKGLPNPVADAIAQLGGLTAAIVKTGYSLSTINRWRALGRITKVDAAFKVADLTGISVRVLGGLERPSSGGGGRNGGSGRATRCLPNSLPHSTSHSTAPTGRLAA